MLLVVILLSWFVIAIRITGSVHPVEQLNGPGQVTESDAHVNHAVVENLVGLLSELAWTIGHLLKQVKSHVHIRVWQTTSTLAQPLGELSRTGLDTLYQGAAREIVWLQTIAAHKLKILPCLGHLIASHKNVDERVIGDKSWRQFNFFHSEVQVLGLLDHSHLCTPFNQSVERNFIYMEKVVLTVT